MDPYMSRTKAKRSLMGAGMQNVMKGFDTYAGSSVGASKPDYQVDIEKERAQMMRYNGPGTFDNRNTYQYTG